MIEADVVLGHVESDSGGILLPIMAHPPNKVSDLSLADFLSTIRNSSTLKGVKLDFKSREAFSASENVLVDALLKQPDLYLWLNADIISGPVNATTKPVDADYFLSACAAKFPEAVLSAGWTTNYGGLIMEGSYTPDHISNMTEALNRNLVVQPVTFAVRAGLAAQSYDTLSNLIDSSVPGTTLTIWYSSDNDYVNIPDLRKLVNNIGKDKIYLDLPEDMTKDLLSESSSISSTTVPLVLSLLSLIVLM
ncbi:hypothetical protein AAG570_006956 [Ranatra chinensis]|uniref:Menorin-like domain-containing protein n=1 Tax=Ranatra chinensis TaxID=642074 RepID=A0ABD0ZIW2_9HEMI